ncbi:hypothetical protein VP01_2722g6 [Puccinia sorghi]|uniref:Uncharacterized protein n=1 Tax=Puccinia sorghi TaxID=27349 RepID=A0A0L6V3F3_9BASI|nr:hypothetical protein VP01_2722g6 [Puccinia sorghi]
MTQCMTSNQSKDNHIKLSNIEFSNQILRGSRLENIYATILKTTIEAIPILTKENFSSWQTQITALFKLGGVKNGMLNREPALEEDNNTTLCAIILSKPFIDTPNNFVNAENEDQAQLLLKAILKLFISLEPYNQARVYNSVSLCLE